MKELEWKVKHDVKDILQACAEVLQRDMGFNPEQIIRYFSVFPMSDIDPLFKSLEDPSADPENWYHLKETQTHIGLLFNYETKEYVLLSPEHDWKRPRIADLKKTEEEIDHEEKIYKEKLDSIKETQTYKKIKPVIKWYFDCPLKFAGIDTPKEYINNLLKKFPQYFKINNENTEELTKSLFEAYHYEERNENTDK